MSNVRCMYKAVPPPAREYYGWSKPSAEAGGAAAWRGEENWLPAAGHQDKHSSWGSSGLQTAHWHLGNSEIMDREQCWIWCGKNRQRAKAMFSATKEQSKRESWWGRREGPSNHERALSWSRPTLCTWQLWGASSSGGMWWNQQEGRERGTRKGGRDRREPGGGVQPFPKLGWRHQIWGGISPIPQWTGKTQHLARPSTVPGRLWAKMLRALNFGGKGERWVQISPCDLREEVGWKVGYSAWKE